MKCFCKSETYSLKVEADYVPDPIWCNECDCNLEIEFLPLSEELILELRAWALSFGKWIGLETGKLAPNAYQQIDEYNNYGKELTYRVKKELGDKYTVIYVPSA